MQDFIIAWSEIVGYPEIINKLRQLMGYDSEHIFKNKLEYEIAFTKLIFC